MIDVIKFQGGLGNQMFQYAMYLALRSKKPYSFFLFDIDGSVGCHNGFELPTIFPSISLCRATWYNRLRYRTPFLFKHLKTFKQPNSLTFYPEFLQKENDAIYDGFWQSEQYFLDVKDTIFKQFSFNETLLNKETLELRNKLLSETESVSVHIRRGDYLSETFRLTCGLEYYQKAISLVSDKLDTPHYYFFSDDIAWVKENFPNLNAIFIDWNKSKDSWQDMYLMSLCRHNIVANSSFSWWGAWLNKNKTKMVIAPSLWFDDGSKQDIHPSSWQLV